MTPMLNRKLSTQFSAKLHNAYGTALSRTALKQQAHTQSLDLTPSNGVLTH